MTELSSLLKPIEVSMTWEKVTRYFGLPAAVLASGTLVFILLSAVFETRTSHAADMETERRDRVAALREMEKAHGVESRKILCYLEEQSKPAVSRNLLRCGQTQ